MTETGRQVYVLGGGGGPRRLARGLIDMEQIDPDAVKVPAWYRPDPGRAGDLAFILFTGAGERTRANRITNGRWALSAFGTASSAALTDLDTVYSATPVYHPSALLMTIGGAIAGGSRLAVAEDVTPENFWDEVRRYGASVVSYTWTMLDEIAEAPANPAENHHPVRLFMGSGMPRSTWKQVSERFAPARVLEFYASTEGDAVLVNLTGEKAGCKGRPLPGSAEVRIAAYDAAAGRLVEGEDGFAESCARRETGMLLAKVRPGGYTDGSGTLRGVFEPGDAWLQTGDQAGTRISFGLLIDEQAKRSPEDVALLFEDRGHTRAAVNERIDNVVKGLLQIGVRQGEHVGVLMPTRPSALTAVAALNRLGAVAVLMRPDAEHEREAELGKVDRIICDPENAERHGGRDGPPGLRARRRRRPAQARPRPDRHGADRPRRGQGARLVPARPRPRRRPRLHPLHRRRRAHAREPDHQRPLGAVGVRHRLLGRAHRSRHGLQRDPRLPPVGAADDDRRRDRRRLAARGRRATFDAGELLGRGPPLRRQRRLLHVDDAATRSPRRRRTRPRSTTRSACSWAPACRARPGSRSASASRPAAGARVLRLDRGRRRPRQPDRREGRLQGPAAAGQRRGPDRRLRRRRRPARSRATTASRELCARREVGMLLAQGPPRRLHRRQRHAARRLRARRRLAADRRPLPPRRRRRLLARRPRARRSSGPPTASFPAARSRTRSRTCPRSGSPSPTASTASRSPPCACARARSSVPRTSTACSGRSARPGGRRSSASSGGSRSPPGTGRARRSCAPRASRTR